MRRLVPTIVLVVVLAAVAAACVPQAEPAQNGRLPDSALTTVTDSCRVANDLADPLRRLMYTSLVDGAFVQPETQAYVAPLPGPPRNESCYRTF